MGDFTIKKEGNSFDKREGKRVSGREDFLLKNMGKVSKKEMGIAPEGAAGSKTRESKPLAHVGILTLRFQIKKTEHKEGKGSWEVGSSLGLHFPRTPSTDNH